MMKACEFYDNLCRFLGQVVLLYAIYAAAVVGLAALVR